MAAEIARVVGPAEAAGFRRYVDFVSKLYRYEMRDFIDRNIDSPLDLLSLNLARLAAIGGFRRLAPKVEQYLRTPGRSGCTRSRRCTPACRRTTRSRSTR